MIQIFGTSKCRVTKAAERFFAERRVAVQRVDLHLKGLSNGELVRIAAALGGVRALYDPEKDPTVRFAAPSDAQLTKMLLEQPTLLRTPIVRDGLRAAVGADEAAWKAFAEAARGK